MACRKKGIIENWRDRHLWRGISLKEVRRELIRLDLEIRREEDELRKLGQRETKLIQNAIGRPEIEKRGIAKEIKSIRREAKASEAMLTNLYNQRATLKQIELYKKMEARAKRKGLQRTFREHQDRIINLITNIGVDITDEMDVWKKLAQETGVVFSSMLENDEEVEDILAEIKEAEMDKEVEDIYPNEEGFDEDEVVTLEKKKAKREE